MRRSSYLPVLLLVALTIPTFSRADEWAPPGRILRARYGVYSHFINVTAIVRHYAFPGGKMDVSNGTFGFDPFKGEKKHLHLVIDTPNGRFERDYDEGDTIRFGGRPE
jgi:hypothetical protein